MSLSHDMAFYVVSQTQGGNALNWEVRETEVVKPGRLASVFIATVEC